MGGANDAALAPCGPSLALASHRRPHAQSTRPTADKVAAGIQRARRDAKSGTTTIGAESAIIMVPAAISP